MNALMMQPIPIRMKGSEAASNGLNITNSPNDSTNMGNRYNGQLTESHREELKSVASWYTPNAVSTPPNTYINIPMKKVGEAVNHSPNKRLPKPAKGNISCWA